MCWLEDSWDWFLGLGVGEQAGVVGTLIGAIALLWGISTHYARERRKKKALRLLLARECEKNNWSISSLKQIVEWMRDYIEAEDDCEFSVIRLPSGKTEFRAQAPKLVRRSLIADIHQEMMSKNMLDVATLDKKLYVSLQPAYDAMSEMEHIRNGLIDYIDTGDQGVLHGFVEYALREAEKAYTHLNRLYHECTSKDLQKKRVR